MICDNCGDDVLGTDGKMIDGDIFLCRDCFELDYYDETNEIGDE